MNLSAIVECIKKNAEVDAVYLYGSQASRQVHPQSDVDLGILFRKNIGDSLDAYVRPQNLKWALELQFPNLEFDVVDIELAPTALAQAIIRGELLFNGNPTRTHRLENAILSRVEEEFDL